MEQSVSTSAVGVESAVNSEKPERTENLTCLFCTSAVFFTTRDPTRKKTSLVFFALLLFNLRSEEKEIVKLTEASDIRPGLGNHKN